MSFKQEKILTIAVPTYNRNEILLRNLKEVINQINEHCKVLILDNNSTIPVEETLKELLNANTDKEILVKRNRVNIGADANILRCFELCDTEWIWVLGDDDAIEFDAIQTILDSIEKNKAALAINFSTREIVNKNLRPDSFTTIGQTEFATRLDFAGNVNFMSATVWKLDKVINKFNLAYKYIYSMSFAFVLPLTNLGDNGIYHFSSRSIIADITMVEQLTSRWQFRDFILGWNTILELPMNDEARKSLAKKMYSWHKPENVAAYLLADASNQKSSGFYYYIASKRLSLYMPSYFTKFRFAFYKILFINPTIGWKLVKKVLILANKMKFYSVDVNDIDGRSRV